MDDDELRLQRTQTVQVHSEHILRLTSNEQANQGTVENSKSGDEDEELQSNEDDNVPLELKSPSSTLSRTGIVFLSDKTESMPGEESPTKESLEELTPDAAIKEQSENSKMLKRKPTLTKLKEDSMTSVELSALRPDDVVMEKDQDIQSTVSNLMEAVDNTILAPPTGMARASSSQSTVVVSRRSTRTIIDTNESMGVGAHSMRGIDTRDSYGVDGEPDEEIDSTAISVQESMATATAVTRDDLEEEVRRQIMEAAIVAHVVPVDQSVSGDKESEGFQTSAVSSKYQEITATPNDKNRLFRVLCIGFSCAVLAGLVGGLTAGFQSSGTSETNESPETEAPRRTSAPEDVTTLTTFLAIQSPQVSLNGSPQNSAMEWMSENSVSTSDPMIWTLFALATFYYSTGGESWVYNENWLDLSVGVCNWYPGDLCSESNTGGNLRKRRRMQHEEAIASALFDIEYLRMGGNNLRGTLPDEIGLLTDLVELVLDDNPALGGTLPDELGALTSLKNFFASRSGFTGMLPSTLITLEFIEEFHMVDTIGLSGPISADLWTRPRIRTLNLEGARLTGTLPRDDKSPKEVYMRNNLLTGTLPVDSSGVWRSIEVLDIRDNLLTGTIPLELSNNFDERLRVIQLEGNNFTGTVPAEVCDHFLSSAMAEPNKIHEISADCGGENFNVTCTCCTLCCIEGDQCQEQ